MPDAPRELWRLVNYLAFLRHYARAETTQDFAARAVRWLEARPSHEATTVQHRIQYGRALYYAGRLEDAQRVLDAMIRAFPNSISLIRRLQRAVVAAARGDTAQALRDADWFERHAETLEGRERERERLWARGVIYGALGERARAMELFRQYEPYWVHGVLEPVFWYEPMRGYPPFEEFLRPKG
jgi:tetratricopeptide (TPR) repeat protein